MYTEYFSIPRHTDHPVIVFYLESRRGDSKLNLVVFFMVPKMNISHTEVR